MAQWSNLSLPAGTNLPANLFEVSAQFDQHLRTGALDDYTPLATGFSPLDDYIGQGLVPESLVLIGGPPNVGKTIFALQIARNIAYQHSAAARRDGQDMPKKRVGVLYLCYEHTEVYLYHRLLCMESFLGRLPDERQGVSMEDIRRVTLQPSAGGGEPSVGLQKLLDHLPDAEQAFERTVDYWESLYLLKGDPQKTTSETFPTYLRFMKEKFDTAVLIVDYLQKVPVLPRGGFDRDPVQTVIEALKNVSLEFHVPVVAVAAGDEEGLRQSELHFENLWGNASINYEPDVAIMLNPTWRKGKKLKQRESEVLFSIEKNRLGPTWVGMLFSLWGKHYTFDPHGKMAE
jgi:replicative DNA helicase